MLDSVALARNGNKGKMLVLMYFFCPYDVNMNLEGKNFNQWVYLQASTESVVRWLEKRSSIKPTTAESRWTQPCYATIAVDIA